MGLGGRGEIAISIAIGRGVFDTTPEAVDGARPVRRPDAGHSFGECFRHCRRVDAVGGSCTWEDGRRREASVLYGVQYGV